MEIFRKIGVWLGLLLAIAGLALWWWLQPERQVRRAEKRLVEALESRDFAALERMLAEDYSDRWGQNKAIVISRLSDVLRQFLFLTVVHEEKALEFSGGGWVLSAKIELKGTGGALAMHAKDELNRLKRPFAITWRNNGGPTKWVIATVAQPELDF